MKKIILFLLFSLAAFAQQTPQQKLEADLKNKTLTLYIQGGFVSRIHKTDTIFREKYKILKFHDFGCVAPPDPAFYLSYNQLLFDYLTKTYGSAWLSEIRDDAMGLHQWKEKRKQARKKQ